MSAKHTPEPWAIEMPFEPDTISIVAGGPETYNWKFVAEVSSQEPGITIKQAQANARLIAASPDLLAACQALLAACEQRANAEGGDFGPDIGPAAALATAAIARATGSA